MRGYTVEEMFDLIQSDDFLEKIFQKKVDWDVRLDARDNEDFDKKWVEEKTKISSVTSAGYDAGKLKKIREATFKKIYRITSSSELAGYASDDLGLIAETFMKGLNSDWIDWLVENYLAGDFPTKLN